MSQPLDYAPPPESRSITSIPLTVGLAIPTALVCFLGVFVAPRLEMIFRDFNAQLPIATKIVLALSRWMVSDFGWLMIWAMPALVPILVARVAPSDRSRLPRWAAMLLGVHVAWPVCGMILAVAIVTLLIPLMSLF